MKSSAGIAGRALIMLACVIGIPALALSGASWSEMLKKLQDFRWQTVLDLASNATTREEAPRFAPTNPAGAPAIGRGPAFSVHAGKSNPLGPMPTSATLLPGQSPLMPSSPVVPAGYQAPAQTTAAAPSFARSPDENAPGLLFSAADPFRSVQERLRQLGATYYLLESWGNQQQLYRFYCKMAIGGSADYTRQFEATEGDPLQAMVQVLRQVESWRGGSMAASVNDERALRN